jgi:CheY-like chemotaxis protein
VNLLVLVVDDESDVEVLFRQQFRHDLRAGRFTMEFAQSAPLALQRINDAAGVSLILNQIVRLSPRRGRRVLVGQAERRPTSSAGDTG